MMSSRSLRAWSWLHTWSSLVCTVFMVLLCLTGLPLIFHHEIEHLSGDAVELPVLPHSVPQVSLDKVMQAALAKYPQRVVQYVSADEEEPRLWHITLTPTPAPSDDYKSIAVDGRNGQVLRDARTSEGFMYWMLRLHVDLFAGLPGMLFLGFMGLLLVIAILSGVVLYAPFMQKIAFGTVRRQRSTRLKWLDLHNLLGIVTLVWMLVVGFTGVVNTWAELLVKYWQYSQVSALLAPYQGKPMVPVAERAPMQATLAAAQAHAPGMRLSFAAMPGTAYSSPHHVTYFMRGDTPFTSKLLRPVLVDARTAIVTASPELPWYLTALLIAQPLHFGDYGGLPMKILWALLDIATLLVLGSGVYRWIRRRAARQPEAALHLGESPGQALL